MKRSSLTALFLGALLLASVVAPPAERKSVTIPKGTKVEKLGPELQADGARRHGLRHHVLQEGGQAQDAAGRDSHHRRLRHLGRLRHPRRQGQDHRHGTIRRPQGQAGDGPGGEERPARRLHQDRRRGHLVPAVIEFPSLPRLQPHGVNKLSPQPDPPGSAERRRAGSAEK